MGATPGSSKGEITRQLILDSALGAFRRRGFERTTMREIADAAGLSLGAAYHYFASKEALLGAYYEWMQAEHERLAAAATAPGADFEARLRVLLVTKIELLRRDRKLFAALFNHLGDPKHPLSVFGKHTAALRERSMAQFVATLEPLPVAPELRELVGKALWLVHLGVFLFFVHDRSREQLRTQRLVGALCELAAASVPWLGHPLAIPLRNRLAALMAELDPKAEVAP